MSRIGKKAIPLPPKVEVHLDGQTVLVKGPKGQMTLMVHPAMRVTLEESKLLVSPAVVEKPEKALHGMTRALLANLVTGVTQGFHRTLLIEGVGYQAEMQGPNLSLRLGHSHPIIVPPPDSQTSFEVPADSRGHTILINGIDKQVVGQIAAEIRKWRPPEPYKGKGIRYEGEFVRRKAGKTG